MVRKKKVSEPDGKINHRGKERFFANLNLSPQPIICLTKLNIPKVSGDGEINNFTVNVKSKSFKKLLIDVNTHKSKLRKRSNNAVKPGKKLQRNKGKSSIKSKSVSFLIDKTDNNVPAIENGDKMFVHENVGESGPSNNGLKYSNAVGDEENQWSNSRKGEFSTSDNGVEDSNAVGDKENQWSHADNPAVEVLRSSKDLASQNEGDPTEDITRADKVIDTFLHVMTKITDDNSILSALQRDYICDHCQQGFLSKGTLRKHILICSLGAVRKKHIKRKKKDETHMCPMCGITYTNKFNLDKHNANVHNLKKMYKCLVCSQHFYNEAALTLHCRSRHGLGSDTYKCPYCEETFSLRNDLNYHCRRAHNTAKYYVCSKCLECFKNEDTCKLHEKSHGYCCEVCMFKTKNESELISHRSTHLYMVVHKCDKCLRTFKAKQYFTKHIKVHEREKKL